MEERPRQDVTDGKSWWCSVDSARLVSQFETGAFFRNQELLSKNGCCLCLWVREYPVSEAADDAEGYTEHSH